MNPRFLSFIIAFATTAIATPIAIFIAPKIGAMDIPKDNRRMHDHPIPRFGGIAIFCGILAAFVILSPLDKELIGLLCAATLICLMGIYDDLNDMNAKLKFGCQIVCASIVWFCGTRFVGITNFFSETRGYLTLPLWASYIITVLWIVGITNTINLIDGLDGLSSGIVFIACLSIAYTAQFHNQKETSIIVLAVAGASLAFLVYNFYPAKIFMGDGGSQLLGFMLASVSLLGYAPTKSTTLFATLVPIMILALPIFDTAFAIIRRAVNHKPIMSPDKGHLHHRIMALGFGQARTVLALYSISAIMGIAGILWTAYEYWEALLLVLIAGTLVFIFLGVGLPGEKSDYTKNCKKKSEDNKDSESVE